MKCTKCGEYARHIVDVMITDLDGHQTLMSLCIPCKFDIYARGYKVTHR